jgi:hypothetical protein
MKKDKRVRVCLSISKSVHTDLLEISQSNNLRISTFCTKIILDYLDNYKL